MTHSNYNSQPQGAIQGRAAGVDPTVVAMRFLRIIWTRRKYVIAAVVLALLLGAVKYKTSEKIYAGKAVLLITQSGDFTDTSMLAGGNTMLPTYAKLIKSARVLKDAALALKQLPPEQYVDFKNKPVEDWPGALSQKLSVRTERLTNLVELHYRSLAPEAAEAVLDAVITAYVDLIERHHQDVSVELLSKLTTDRDNVVKELQEKQRQLIQYKDSVRYVGVQDGGKASHATVVKMNQLHASLMEVRRSRIDHEAGRSAVQETIGRGGDVSKHLLELDPALGRQLLTNALGIGAEDNETLSILQRRLVEDEATLQGLSQRLGPNHAMIQELTSKINLTNQYIAQFRDNTRRTPSQLDGAELNQLVLAIADERLAKEWAKERQLELEYRAAEQEAVKMNSTLTKVQFAEEELSRLNSFYRSLSDQIASVDLKQEHVDVRVEVTSDPVATGPVEPQAKLIGATSLVLGMLAGVAVAFLIDLLDDHFRSPDEIRHELGVPVLAMVRMLEVTEESGLDSLQVYVNPESVACESFRTLRTTLAFSGEDLSRVGVTSTAPGDGKTTVLANLAVSYAQAGRRTLLIDADLRRPGLSNLFELRKQLGLADVLYSNDPLDQLSEASLNDVGVPNLSVMPCGHKPPNPVELLSSQRMVDLMAWAQKHFDQVLIDCPPVVAGSDAVLVGRLMDGLIVVLDPSKNPRRSVIRTVESVVNMRVNVLGVVANRIDAGQQQGYGYGYGYGDGYGYGYGEDDDETRQAPEEPVSIQLAGSRDEHSADRTSRPSRTEEIGTTDIADLTGDSREDPDNSVDEVAARPMAALRRRAA